LCPVTEAERSKTVTEAADQAVNVLITVFDSIHRKQEVLDVIERLARLPGGERKARKHLLAFADKFADCLLEPKRIVATRKPRLLLEVRRGFAAIDGLLSARVLAPNWRALAREGGRTSGRWEARSIITQLDRIERRFKGTFRAPQNLFRRSWGLLRWCEKRKVANMLAKRVAGHLKQPEVVWSIKEAVYNMDEVEAYVTMLKAKS